MCFSKRLCVLTGFFAIVVSAVAVAAAVYQGVDLTYIHSHFLQLAVASFLISVLLSVYLYVRSRYTSPEQLALGGNSGKQQDPELLIRYYLLCLFLEMHQLQFSDNILKHFYNSSLISSLTWACSVG